MQVLQDFIKAKLNNIKRTLIYYIRFQIYKLFSDYFVGFYTYWNKDLLSAVIAKDNTASAKPEKHLTVHYLKKGY